VQELGLLDRKGNKIKLGDRAKFFKVGHSTFEANIYYGQSAIREDMFGRCLWDYTAVSLGENVVNCQILDKC
jgi:hypothetical protein